MTRLNAMANQWFVRSDTTTASFLLPAFDEQWAPVVGPSVLALVRYMARRCTPKIGSTTPAFYAEPWELAAGIGVTRTDVLKKTIQRAERFGLLRIEENNAIVLTAPSQLPAPTVRLSEARNNWLKLREEQAS